MAWVERLVTRTTQPQDAVGIDWSNVIAKGLVRFGNAAYASQGFLADSANPKITYSSSVPGLSTNGCGKSVAKNLTVVWVGSSSEGQGGIGTGDATFVFGGVNRSNSTTQYFCQIGGQSSVAGNVFVGDRAGSLSALNVFGGTLSVAPVAGHVAGRFETTVIVRRSGVSHFWMNGAYLGSASNTSGFGNFPFSLGSSNGGSQRDTNFGGLYTLALSDADAQSMSQNPWQIFEPEVQRVWVDDVVSAGGPATVIPIGVQVLGSAGATTATGAANTGVAGVQTTGAIGVPTVSVGTTAQLIGVQVSSSVGALTATGQAATVPVGVQASSAVGAPAAIGGGSAIGTPAGVQTAANVNTLTASGQARAYPAGAQVSSWVGAPAAVGGATAFPGGVLAPSATGTPYVDDGVITYSTGAAYVPLAANQVQVPLAANQVQVPLAANQVQVPLAANQVQVPLAVNQAYVPAATNRVYLS